MDLFLALVEGAYEQVAFLLGVLDQVCQTLDLQYNLLVVIHSILYIADQALLLHRLKQHQNLQAMLSAGRDS